MVLLSPGYVAPRFFKNAYLQTAYSIYLRKVPEVPYFREKLITPDHDFLYLDWVTKDPKKLVILTHGITGSSHASYMRGMANIFLKENWSVLAWNMRGRGGQTSNWQKKNYHLGFTDDLRFIIDYAVYVRKFQEIVLVGFSMGGNISLKYLGEEYDRVLPHIKACVAFSAPIDAVSCGDLIDRTPQRLASYHLLRDMVRSISSKASLLSPIMDLNRFLKVKTWREFDEIYTAPVYGFDSVLEYRIKAGAKPLLPRIQIPTLLINAKDDPLLSPECCPDDKVMRNHPFLFCEFPDNGGHLGFVSFDKPGWIWSETRSLDFVKSVL